VRANLATGLFSKNPSSSNKTRTADTSSCTGSLSAVSSNSDNGLRHPPRSVNSRLSQFRRRFRRLWVRFVGPCPPTLSSPCLRFKCGFRYSFPACYRAATAQSPRERIRWGSYRRLDVAHRKPATLQTLLSRSRGKITAPAIGHDEPRSQTPPYLQILPAIGDSRSVGLSDRY
jgi:hypothetical protein